MYVRDTGLLHFLAGLRSPSDLITWSRRGSSFEGAVIEELITQSRQRFVRPEAFFWRTQAGAEVDLLLQDGTKILPFEIKLSSTVGARELNGLRQCMEDLNIKRGAVIYSGNEHRSVGHGIELLPWKQVQRGAWDF